MFVYSFIIALATLSFSESLKLAVVGSGPSGLFLSAKILSSVIEGSCDVTEIDIYELRDDPRKPSGDPFRSFAIGCTSRIWNAVKMYDSALVHHLQDGYCSLINTTYQVSERKHVLLKQPPRYMTHQPMFSSGLLTWIEKLSKSSYKCKLKTMFNTKCIAVDSLSGCLVTQGETSKIIQSKTYDLIIGADGAKSVVKQAVMQQRTASWESFENPGTYYYEILHIYIRYYVSDYHFLITE